MKYPTLQVALDFINLSRAVKAAEGAAAGGCDWFEAGTPLIKSEGLNAVRELRRLFPGKTIIADMKIMDAGRIEVESAAKAGADIVCVLAAATDATIKECIEAGKNYGAKISVDLLGIHDQLRRAKQIEQLGVDLIGVHCPIDEQMQGKELFDTLKVIAKETKLLLSIAGGIHSETAADAVLSGASVIIVGGAITKTPDPRAATETLIKAIHTRSKIRSQFFKRGALKDVRSILKKVSTANVSDAMHRSGNLHGILPVTRGLKAVGKAVTVRTYPGDWAKTVQAVDQAQPGDVIVIDAGGIGPAVWGELATHGALQKKISGIVIDGALRDIKEIGKLKFAAFTRLVTPCAGEPRGFGEIGIPITVGGVKVHPGDWIIGDDDGVCVIPENKVVEVANRAMSVLETENRLRNEIGEGSTLGAITELLKWERQK